MKTRSILSIAILGATAILSSLTPVLAEETTCNNTLGAVTVDNLLVPKGANCTLSKTRVKGNIKVESGATLRAINVRIGGNIQAEKARNVVVDTRSVIGGSIDIKQSGGASITNSRINQDLKLESNIASLVTNGNKIGGNLQAFKNTGGVTIRNNQIDGNLQCKQNDSAPSGGSNQVRGKKENQCSRL
jgi:hypothetical protein